MHRLARAGAAALLFGAAGAAWAGLPTFCERPRAITAAEQDRVLRFAGAVKEELERSGQGVALIARAGVDLERFGLLYSHAGVALRDNPGSRWGVRQLYYACEESRPRLFDQGISGFALGAEAPSHGHVSLLFLPDEQGAQLEKAALHRPLALALLAGQYSANAYAFGTRYQNCNGWVAELLAGAWGGAGSRTEAQAWLRARDYAAGPVRIPSHMLMFAGQFVPLVHLDDHPIEDIHALALQVSVPDAIERFVRRQLPQARHVELCHDTRQIVVRRDGPPLGAECRANLSDEIITLTLQ